MPFIEAQAERLYPINELPSKENYPPELKREFKYFSRTVEVIEAGIVPFAGQTYLLIDDRVYSAADSFCIFAKTTNWATLAGEPTAGSGAGFSPIIMALPNSGLLLMFPPYMSLRTDGSTYEEFSIIPDIVAENPLDQVLRIINTE